MNATLDQMKAAIGERGAKSPFLLENETAYRSWRARKLELRARLDPRRVFALDSGSRLPRDALAQAALQVAAYGFVTFETAAVLGKDDFLALNRQFGLARLDCNPGADADRVTSLRVVDAEDERAQYIPYSNRALNWHTDGYYNPARRRIGAFALYCIHQAGRGGGNFLFDHEYLYLLIRDREPELMRVLMAPDLMRVPPNVQDRRILRAEETGPVFFARPDGRGLGMRYTSRPRNIVWKDDEQSARALDRVREILLRGDGIIDVRLRPRQGLICSNLLHGREAFSDLDGQPARLIYRARYLDEIDCERGA